MKISILTPDFSNNCFGRAWLLAKLLKKNYDIEVIGPAFQNKIWEPVSGDCNFKTVMIDTCETKMFDATSLIRSISGDVIYASKPLFSSFGMGLIKKIAASKPLVLDIDDYELGFGKEDYDSFKYYEKIISYYLCLIKWESYHYKILMDKCIKYSTDITVSGKGLQLKYGGDIIWHGRDIDVFNPSNYNNKKIKKKYLPDHDNPFIIGFIGTPRPHKGLDDFIEAVSILKSQKVLAMIVGMDSGEYSDQLKMNIKNLNLEDSFFLMDSQPFNNLPELLSMMDIIVVPQRGNLTSHYQVPAKLFDAMAMAKPIISTEISDIPHILKNCGWVVPPNNPVSLAEAMAHVINHPDKAYRMGRKARERCIKNYSWEVLSNKLKAVFEKYNTTH